MAASLNRATAPKGPDGQRAAEALNRGELVQVLADADMGKIDQEELEKALEQREKRHWFKQLVRLILFPR